MTIILQAQHAMKADQLFEGAHPDAVKRSELVLALAGNYHALMTLALQLLTLSEDTKIPLPYRERFIMLERVAQHAIRNSCVPALGEDCCTVVEMGLVESLEAAPRIIGLHEQSPQPKVCPISFKTIERDDPPPAAEPTIIPIVEDPS